MNNKKLETKWKLLSQGLNDAKIHIKRYNIKYGENKVLGQFIERHFIDGHFIDKTYIIDRTFHR